MFLFISIVCYGIYAKAQTQAVVCEQDVIFVLFASSKITLRNSARRASVKKKKT